MSCLHSTKRSLSYIMLAGWLLFGTAMAAKLDAYFGPNETNVVIELTKEGLVLGQTRIEPWPFVVPACDECELTVTQSLSLAGLTRTLSLSKSGTGTAPRWFFAQVLKPNERLPTGVVVRARESGVILERAGEQSTLGLGEQQSIDNCRYQLAWFERDTNQSIPATAGQPEVITEEPSASMQVIGWCQ
jgi:hypothetical protein